MDNKVVTTAVRSARDLGFNTLRFNFRGVGNSTGSHDNGQGEQNDVLAALHYAKEELGWQTIILCGFSFGQQNGAFHRLATKCLIAFGKQNRPKALCHKILPSRYVWLLVRAL